MPHLDLPERATRADLARLLTDLLEPVATAITPGAAGAHLGPTGSLCDAEVAAMEGFARPLWGIAPLIAGGQAFPAIGRWREGIAHGTDPSHPAYWGAITRWDQRTVECAALATALLLAPDAFWQPLDPVTRGRVSAYLTAARSADVPANNWLWFRVLADLAIERCGGQPDRARRHADLDVLETFHRGAGWYADGADGPCDLYGPFALHCYGLLYAVLAGSDDRARSERLRARAALFARAYVHWFDADGAIVPHGRSLAYRFAAGAFWGALAFAGVEAFPPGVLKGLLFRHLRWWLARDAVGPDGRLAVGHAYPNARVVEDYVGPGSPYWACKAFLPLALADDSPFWRADESPLPPLPATVPQREPGVLIQRDHTARHVVALCAGQTGATGRHHRPECYFKFCYSSVFAFSVPAAPRGLEQGAHDSMLALSEDGTHFRVRCDASGQIVAVRAAIGSWQPWPDVAVRTWLIAVGAWHVRVHRVQATRPLLTAEGGFALARDRSMRTAEDDATRVPQSLAHATGSHGTSAIHALGDTRSGRVLVVSPNTNLHAPRTVLPTLLGRHEPGVYWLACAVFGSTIARLPAHPVGAVPRVRATATGFHVVDPTGEIVHRSPQDDVPAAP